MSTSTGVGRGFLSITFAKLYFMVAGYVLQFTLPRLLGSPALFGEYTLVVGLVSVFNNVIVTGTIQGISKFTAQREGMANAVKRAGLRVHLFLGLGVAATFVITAPYIARWENDLSLTPLYRLSAIIIACYSFYAVFVGSLNGQRLFSRQASLDIGFATLRMVLILGGAALGWHVMGAIGGFVVAAAIILLVSMAWVGLPSKASAGDQAFSQRQLLKFFFELFIYNLGLNLLMRADLLLLKRYVATMAMNLGTTTDAAHAAEVASTFSGYYGAAQNLAFIPYQAILAVAFVIFPLLSRSTFEQDQQTTQNYIRQTLRLSTIFAAGVAVVFMANPTAVMKVPYPAVYGIAGPTLQYLSIGILCFSVFTIMNTILNSAGHTYAAIVSAAVTLAIDVVANMLWVPRAPGPEAAMLRAAIATCVAMAIGMGISSVFTYRYFKAGIALPTLTRIGIAIAVAIVCARIIPDGSRIATLLECFVVFGVYIATLIVLREFKRDDLAKLKSLRKRAR